jgi:hypothetical protein
MKFAACVFGCVLVTGFLLPMGAQVSPSAVGGQHTSPWWVSGEFGAGQIKLISDVQQGNRTTTFAMGFAGGYQPSDFVRVGLHLNGWLLEMFDPYNPIKGESVSNVGGVVDVFPSRRSRLFARGGFGWSSYTNNHPTGVYGSGSGWEVGGGYEMPVYGRIRLAPLVEYAEGGLGKGAIALPVQPGLRYSVVEFKLAVIGSFGRRRR